MAAVIWVFTALLNGSEPWVSLDTPDSEFHASMAIYGSEVTDRATVPVYYWTRIGHIAPAHVLTKLLGPVPGLEVYRLLLIAVIVGCLFATLRHFTGRLNATILTLLAGANTVLLGYLGNPYPTATSMAAMFALIALAVLGNHWGAHCAAGGVLAWLVMTSPYGTLLGLVVYLSSLIARRAEWPMRIRPVLTWAAAVAIGGAVVFGALWLVGRALFPSLDWLSTYLYWNSVLDQSAYIYDLWQWTRDPSLVVPAVAVGIGIISLVVRPRDTGTRVGAALAIATPAFAVGYWWLWPTNYLEIPHYQAMLFPAALTAIAVIASARLPDSQATWPRGAIGAVLVGLSVLAGHATPSFSTFQARVIAAVCVVVFVLPWGRRWIAVMVATGITFAGAQLLQNSRGTFGVSTAQLYANAYQSNETESMVTAAVAAQTWVLSQTRPGDRVLTWVDADWASQEYDLLPLAAFQLWGANEAARGPVASPADVRALEAGKPQAIVMYGKSLESVLTFWNALPKEWRSTPPECTNVPWPQTGTADVCVTRIDWERATLVSDR